MPKEMTEEELEDWGLAFVEEHEDEDHPSLEGLTDQQREWLDEFFAEIDPYRD